VLYNALNEETWKSAWNDLKEGKWTLKDLPGTDSVVIRDNQVRKRSQKLIVEPANIATENC